jgi:hypothetical protein
MVKQVEQYHLAAYLQVIFPQQVSLRLTEMEMKEQQQQTLLLISKITQTQDVLKKPQLQVPLEPLQHLVYVVIHT